MKERIKSIDLLRGIVMVIMVLDHTGDFVTVGYRSATDLQITTFPLFMTRWITHFCAPVFVFLAGLAAYLQLQRGKTKLELTKFLITRGLWLIFLEITWVNFFIFLPLKHGMILLDFLWLQVIWAIGVSMIFLAGLIHLPFRWISGIGLGMILFHNLSDHINFNPNNHIVNSLWLILHKPGMFHLFEQNGPSIFVLYPLIPWIGVMAAGYTFGVFYGMEAEKRRKYLLMIGAITSFLFLVLRFANFYGDPSKWTVQNTALFTILSFLNTTKYPPSLLFLLMTLGPAILLLCWLEKIPEPEGRGVFYSKIYNAMLTFGRVPLFFYLLQWPVVHINSILLYLLAGKPVQHLFMNPALFFDRNITEIAGFCPAWTYIMWILNILVLYLPCKWYAGVKKRYNRWFLAYI
ncbi:MAG TPA: heparan-alpha-glucosaminide N-acetyltransferase domain-containing protein [bacterium]|nr:heparan-alpha-glucosaminide N-acetyltransferase domain-containing protein [bacterium]